uniref:Uncharacterized protein n=1 Tax=Anguilla anguilla TaxID=7936 RepID=A0A0E9TNB9_ANGAN
MPADSKLGNNDPAEQEELSIRVSIRVFPSSAELRLMCV